MRAFLLVETSVSFDLVKCWLLACCRGLRLPYEYCDRGRHIEFVSFPGLPLLYPVEDMGPVASILWSDLLS